MQQIERYLVPVIACVPVSVTTTLIASPVWKRVEKLTGINAIGHFGPAGWCFVVVYIASLLAFFGYQKMNADRKKLKS